jgi:hypothetical protein
MHDHDGSVLPHHAHREPQRDSDHEGQHVPRNDVQTGQTIADKLDDRGDPFDDVDTLEARGLGCLIGHVLCS